MSSTIVISPTVYDPAYGGIFSNGRIAGYGTISDNNSKVIQQGYFSNGVLDSSPLVSSYIEWTTAPEQVLMVLGNFVTGKADGVVYKYQSTGSIYCVTGNNASDKIVRTRYILANKTKQTCTAGSVDSSTSMGTVTLMMNWTNNNLLSAFDIGVVSLDAGYEVDNAARVDSARANPPSKNAFVNSIYN